MKNKEKIDMRTYWNVFFLLFFSASFLYGRQDTVNIQLNVRNVGDKVLLRWAVTTPRAWKLMNTTGFFVERYTIARGGNILPEQERKLLTPTALKPLPEEAWGQIVNRDQYAALIAQSLFGDSFEIIGMASSNAIEKIVDQAEELEQRHSFSLFSADMSFEAACYAGWGLTDNETAKGERYLYRVIPASDKIIYTNGGYGFVVMDSYKELPPPVYFSAEFGDKMALLSWNVRLQKSLFVSYWVEKSENGKNFKKMDIPITSFQETPNGHLVYVDSLDQNNKTYYYRVRGQSMFGEISKPSEVISGKGIEELKAVPQITRYFINETGSAEIEWSFDEAYNHLLQSFSLHRAVSDTSAYETVVADIKPEGRRIVFDRLQRSNYFTISANPHHGQPKVSFPVLILPVDTVPPSQPSGLQASVDSTGIVSISWEPNQDIDILGYKIYRGNKAGEELIAIHKEPVIDTACTDTVDLLNLNTHVYYFAIAFDKRYNQSIPSDTFRLEKPLQIRPSSPVFSTYRSTPEGIVLNWINSPDKEVVKHTLYRQEKDSLEIETLAVFEGANVSQYNDSLIDGNTLYVYTVTATGKWGAESEPSPSLTIRSMPQSGMKIVQSFHAEINMEARCIDLFWEVSRTDKIDYFKIYRSENDKKVTLWKEIPGTESRFSDLTAQPGAKQNYLIIAVLKVGGESNSLKTSIIF
ncbi:MAG: hypothetical protein LBJ72_13385 [Dysgonamonadaceae bacterium]|nr:hypothetical protein [Dysgonamonadaceae bacterium]